MKIYKIYWVSAIVFCTLSLFTWCTSSSDAYSNSALFWVEDIDSCGYQLYEIIKEVAPKTSELTQYKAATLLFGKYNTDNNFDPQLRFGFDSLQVDNFIFRGGVHFDESKALLILSSYKKESDEWRCFGTTGHCIESINAYSLAKKWLSSKVKSCKSSIWRIIGFSYGDYFFDHQIVFYILLLLFGWLLKKLKL